MNLHPIMLHESVNESEYSEWSQTFNLSLDFLQDSALHQDLPPTDLFAFAFVQLSRYEEYLPFTPDKHDRFTSDSSILKKYAVLHKPIVDTILLWFSTYVNTRSGHELTLKHFQKTDLTFDIDHMWKYKHKSSLVTLGGYFKDLIKLNFSAIKERTWVLKSLTSHDTYDLRRWKQYIDFSQTTFFVLLNKRTHYDKGISPAHPAFAKAIRQLVGTSDVGIHPGYETSESLSQLTAQIEIYHSLVNAKPLKSRQHYLRLKFPTTHRLLIESGIKQEYSLGYADDIGYRAGTSRPYLWFDLDTNLEKDLTFYPFAVMDVTLINYLALSPKDAFSAVTNLINSAAEVQGTCRLIWHNSSPFWEENWAPYLNTFELFKP